MHARCTQFLVLVGIMALAACADRPDPARIGAPSFAVGGVGRPTVLVNPKANDNGTAKTIQEGIDMVASGGQVLVTPGTYDEAIVIDKGLALEAIAGESEPVIVAPSGSVNAAMTVASTSNCMYSPVPRKYGTRRRKRWVWLGREAVMQQGRPGYPGQREDRS